MIPTSQRFEVNQYPISGGCLLIAGMPFFLGMKNAHGAIHTKSSECSIKILKAGRGIPLGTNTFVWSDLVTFTYSDWDSEEAPSLELRWRDDIYQTYWGGEVKAFHEYLQMFFPEHETEAPEFRFG